MSILYEVKTPNINLPREAISELCARYGVRELALFGSVLGPDFGPQSDIDFLVSFGTKDFGPWMAKLQDFEEELSQVVGRRVDVVLKSTLDQSANYIRREQIRQNAREFYVA